MIDTPPAGRERLCVRCVANEQRHRIVMNFMLIRDAWQISFLEADCRTSLRKKLRFAIPEKIFDMARRGGADLTSASRCDLELGISIGRGGIWLNLTLDQYTKLRYAAGMNGDPLYNST